MRNEGFSYREQIGAGAEGERLIDYLARRYPHSSGEAWRERIAAGRVLLDRRPAHADSLLERGQVLVWSRPPWEEPDAPVCFGVLFEDDQILAVAKPAGLPTLPGGGFLRATLLHRVREYVDDARPLHRLGRWTSGVVLCARTRQARADLTRQWTEGRVGKRYRALASGIAREEVFDVTTPIGPVPHSLLGTVHGASPEGKSASTRVEMVEQRGDGFVCDVTIATGRPHQIRIHLAAAGHPLAGDRLYGAGGTPSPDCRALPGDPGYLLHSAELSFRHPATGREMTVACAPPPKLRAPRLSARTRSANPGRP